MPKNTFFEDTKKIFFAKNFLGLFVHVQRWLVQKKTLITINYKRVPKSNHLVHLPTYLSTYLLTYTY